DEHRIKDLAFAFADEHYFSTFGIRVLQGNPDDLATRLNAFVSERFVKEHFAGENPIGKVLSLEKKLEITIRGVYEDTPENTRFHYDLIISIRQGEKNYVGGGSWRGNDIYPVILRLKEGVDRETVVRGIGKAMEQYKPNRPDADRLNVYDALPLVDRHLENEDNRTRLYIYGFLGFAVFFVAIMNYVLIAVATMNRRAKSVGVHKCSGASTGNIFGMFLLETAFVVVAAVLLSLFLIINAKDMIEDLLSVHLESLFTWDTLWVPLLTIFVLFVIAGVLPGRLFSQIPVTQVFRRYTDSKKGWKRSMLFVQFTGVAFVLGVLLVSFMQYSHLAYADHGFRSEGLAEASAMTKKEALRMIKEDLLRRPMVESVASSHHPVIGQYWTTPLNYAAGNLAVTLMYNPCDKDYVRKMGITIVEGKDLQNPGDMLVNEEVVRLMQWTDGAVDKTLGVDMDGNNGPIVGVFCNVRNLSMQHKQYPTALVCEEIAYTFNVRLKAPYEDNLKRLNDYVAEVYPEHALEFRLTDAFMREVYKDTERFRNSVWIASTFILLIVFMGLIGYINDETQRRSKEIAIRKVNGAEASDILKLLSKDILYVSVPSVIIGTSASYFVGEAWLKQFAETIPLHPLLFVATAVGVLILIVTCVVLKAWKIANENPVLSIKSE
ncbi:MAG: FtsX-like permease family protein, partial [Bacteroides sp.]|nr:FtsX-like permease family protein [Bacteroides sp.]